MQRVLRYDGLLPTKLTSSGAIAQLEQGLSLVQSHQSCSEKGCRGIPLTGFQGCPLVFPLSERDGVVMHQFIYKVLYVGIGEISTRLRLNPHKHNKTTIPVSFLISESRS